MNQPNHEPTVTRRQSGRWPVIGRLLLTAVLLALVVPGTVAAQDTTGEKSVVCQDESDTLASMIEGVVKITTGLGIIGLLVVWQAESLMSMFALGHEQKTKLKHHRNDALRSAATLVVLGPLFTVGSSVMGLPVASCVDLIPF